GVVQVLRTCPRAGRLHRLDAPHGRDAECALAAQLLLRAQPDRDLGEHPETVDADLADQLADERGHGQPSWSIQVTCRSGEPAGARASSSHTPIRGCPLRGTKPSASQPDTAPRVAASSTWIAARRPARAAATSARITGRERPDIASVDQ